VICGVVNRTDMISVNAKCHFLDSSRHVVRMGQSLKAVGGVTPMVVEWVPWTKP
jgi:hypothetical protein